MTTPFDLSGQTAIVTGANTGIGQAIALSLAAAGADIAAVGRTPAQETVEKVRALGRQAQIVSADLSSIEPVQRVVDERWRSSAASTSSSTMPASSAAPTASTLPLSLIHI